MKKVSYLNAVRDGIAEEMRKDPTIFMIGEGISERGGSYAQTKDLWAEFGDERIVDAPISENGWAALSVGAAENGLRPIMDIMICDIINEMGAQIFNQASKNCYLSNGQITTPIVIRAQGGGGIFAGHHSSTLYSVAMHYPGMKVIYPGSVYDAKGLMKTALHCNNPVYFCEDKTVFGKREEIPEEEYYVPFDEAAIRREGKDATVVAIGGMNWRVMNALSKGMIEEDIEVIDPRCLYPLNFKEIRESVKKTGRLVIVEDDFITCGAAAEIAALVTADPELFNCLKAPIERVCMPDITHPYAMSLVKACFPDEEKIAAEVKQVCTEGK